MSGTKHFVNPPIVELVLSAQYLPIDGWNEIIDQLIGFSDLQNDWDGEGSDAPTRSIISCASKFALRQKALKTPPADRVSVSVNGTIYFEWNTPEGYLEIEATSAIDLESRWVAKGSHCAEVNRFSIG